MKNYSNKVMLTKTDYENIYNIFLKYNKSTNHRNLLEGFINSTREFSPLMESIFQNKDYRQYSIYSDYELRKAKDMVQKFFNEVGIENVEIDVEDFFESLKHVSKDIVSEIGDYVRPKINFYDLIEQQLKESTYLKDDKLRTISFYLNGLQNKKLELNTQTTKETLENIVKFIYVYYGQNTGKLIFKAVGFIIDSNMFTEDEKKDFFCKLLEKEPSLVSNKKEFAHIYNYFKDADFTDYFDKYKVINHVYEKQQPGIVSYDVLGKNYLLNIKSLALENGVKSNDLSNNTRRFREYLILKSREIGFELIDKGIKGNFFDFTIILTGNNVKIYDYINELINNTIDMTKVGHHIDTEKDYKPFELYNKLKNETPINENNNKKFKI